MTKIRRLSWFSLALLLSACGFHLQSPAELPPGMQRTKLAVVGPYTEFARRLEIHLEQSGVHVVDDADDAALLEVPQNSVRREIQSIGDNARVREFMLRHTIQFRLLDNNGKVLIPLQTLEQTRVYSFDQQDILSKEREDEFLRDDLSDALARMVVRRLGTYGK